jgi:phage/plasmid-like protein (TIGR03299 family)
MAHLVENMFSVKEVPWHGLGNIIQDAPTTEEVLKLAGLNWSVSKQQLELNGKKVDQFAIVRDSDSSVLGFCGKRYEPIQNQSILNFFEPFAKSGLVDFETAGSLKDGQKVWIMARLKSAEMDIVKGDAVRKYLMFSSGHDGFTASAVGFTPVRIVCANTLAMAHSDSQSKLMRVFHSKKATENLE